MGKDVTVIGQHTLNIKNRKLLIKELAERFDTNVYYGFSCPHDWIGDKLPTFESLGIENPYDDESKTYLLDHHLLEGNSNSMVLLEVYHYFRWFLQQYGVGAGYRDEFIKVWGKDPIDNNETIKSFAKGDLLIDFHFKNLSGTLALESAYAGYDYFYCGWNYFWSLVLRDDSDIDLTYEKLSSFLDYRNTNRDTIKKLGGNCIYYVNDEGRNTGECQGNEWSLTWSEIEKSYQKSNVKEHTINLCEALTNPQYLKMINKKIKYTQDFSVFYDDFRELRMDDIILEVFT